MFIDWFTGLSLEPMLVFIYMVVVGCLRGVEYTLRLIPILLRAKLPQATTLQWNMLFTWWLSIAYWFIF